MDKSIQEKVYSVFGELGISYEKVDHRALFSQADNDESPININGVILKNLFLRNKNKGKYYLFTLPLDKKADLLSLQHELDESRLSFGNEEMLAEKLNTIKGSVSLLNIIGVESTDVVFLIDQEIYQYEKIALHPNDNTASVIFSPKDIKKVLDHYNVEYRFI